MACHYKPYHLHYEKKKLDIDSNIQRTKSALLVVNVQKAFLPGGSMAILNGRADAKSQSVMMINNINSLIEGDKFDYLIYVQDSHPHNHVSFASARNGKPFQIVEIEKNGIKYQQILWPDHCRIDGRDYAPKSITGALDDRCESGSGIQFATELRVPSSFIQKSNTSTNKIDKLDAKSFVVNIGENVDVESYSAFKNYLGEETGLATSLISAGVRDIYVVGLSRDFMAWWTALDGASYVDSNTSNSVFNVNFVWDSTLPAPGSDKLLEYEYDGDIESPHHNRLRSAITVKEYGIPEVMRGLISPDPLGNRWVQTYLTPYNVKAVKTSDLLGIPINATIEYLKIMESNTPSSSSSSYNGKTERRQIINKDLSFLKNTNYQDSMDSMDSTLSTLKSDE